ncbi:hypothetical protein AGABI1DRAFT_123773 [Agaricus bisporus var. burnettii JB137-S8]|uniref:DNA repair protein RAD14 n=1 Tax=Agaricus bisporus var. burnettii (strain JB137-S8 / ATCC MYA-4627 / FGSC 10392) TaxID=597362 RepID=K5W9A0_AGABU|nr:uncharacterized protein AGABI1DRAFT_123773 [Agaricus bisporus var. burnettii JB137-S8]EKM83444.1 hypothetical protein AGABI1DRAFT_123773 [Agaricus bisporus var. burnettii JB137-S8]
MSDQERPHTPSTSAARTMQQPTTPDRIKQIEINRLRAKAALRQKEADSIPSNIRNVNNKRPLDITTSPTAPGPTKQAPLKRDSRLGKYFDYDLSKMVNTKGGFLVEDGQEVDEERIRKEKERERQRARQDLEPPIALEPGKTLACIECQTLDIDLQFRKVFRCLVCKKCQNEMPEKYSLLTKTECKEDYLLTDPEMRDEEALPHLLKANPHASTYANMMLYVRYQVEEFAWKKWGSPEALDAEYERRTREKKKKKNKKFEESLRELRKKTKESSWQRRKDEEHKHSFGPNEKGEDGIVKQICDTCGFTLEFEEL